MTLTLDLDAVLELLHPLPMVIITTLPPHCAVCVFSHRPPSDDEYVRWQLQYRHVPCPLHRGRPMPRPK